MNHRRLEPIGVLPLILLFAVFGCSKNPDSTSETSATLDEQTDAAEDFAATVADSEEGMIRLWNSSPAEFVAPQEKKSEFEHPADTSFIRHGLTYSIEVTYFDMWGDSSKTYDSTSMWVTRHLTISGTITRPRRTVTLNHDGFERLVGIGIQDSLQIMNGQGQRSATGHFQARWRALQRDIDLRHQWEFGPLGFNADRTQFPYPMDGHISNKTTIHRTVSRPQDNVTVDISFEQTVTFDGTRYARVDVTDGPTYWIDLKDGGLYKLHP